MSEEEETPRACWLASVWSNVEWELLVSAALYLHQQQQKRQIHWRLVSRVMLTTTAVPLFSSLLHSIPRNAVAAAAAAAALRLECWRNVGAPTCAACHESSDTSSNETAALHSSPMIHIQIYTSSCSNLTTKPSHYTCLNTTVLLLWLRYY